MSKGVNKNHTYSRKRTIKKKININDKEVKNNDKEVATVVSDVKINEKEKNTSDNYTENEYDKKIKNFKSVCGETEEIRDIEKLSNKLKYLISLQKDILTGEFSLGYFNKINRYKENFENILVKKIEYFEKYKIPKKAIVKETKEMPILETVPYNKNIETTPTLDSSNDTTLHEQVKNLYKELEKEKKIRVKLEKST